MVAAVPGSKTVEVVATQNFSTVGTRACRPAKDVHIPRQPPVSRKTLLNKKALAFLMVVTR